MARPPSVYVEVENPKPEELRRFGGRAKHMGRHFQHLGCLLTAIEARGFFDSAAQGASVRDGEPWPLLTWPFLDWLACFDWSALTLVELGAGRSTPWFAARFARVVSLETDARWFEALKPRLPANVDLRHVPAERLEAGDWDATGDIVLIDCAANRRKVTAALLESGAPPLVVLDNAEWYPNTAAAIAAAGYREIPFWGFKSGEDWESCTTLFLASDARLPPRRNVMPAPSARPVENDGWDRL